MSYPKDGDVIFLLCDDVRREEDGKFSLIGVTTSGRMELKGTQSKQEGSEIAVPKLSMFFTFKVGSGVYDVKLKLRSPSGQVLSDDKGGALSKDADKALNIYLTATPFLVPELGEYSIELMLDDESYHRSFTLVAG